ncbi:hypothetical protein PAMP_016235 [Pampus punctatissimus]
MTSRPEALHFEMMSCLGGAIQRCTGQSGIVVASAVANQHWRGIRPTLRQSTVQIDRREYSTRGTDNMSTVPAELPALSDQMIFSCRSSILAERVSCCTHGYSVRGSRLQP